MVTSFGKNISNFPPNLTPGYQDIAYIGQRQTDGTYTDSFVTQQDLTKKRVVSKAASYPMVPNDDAVLADATSGAVTITLISASGIAGVVKLVKKVDSSGNAITIATTGGQTIDGASTKSLASQYKFMILMSDGTNWQIIGSN